MSENKQELNLEELDEVAGGGKHNKYKNSNNGGGQISQQGEGNQINNQNGKMNTGNGNNIIQDNHISNNKGDVKVGSPVNVSGGSNNTYNMNF